MNGIKCELVEGIHGLAGQLGAAFFLPTLVVPLLLITHGVAFRILLQHHNAAAVQGERLGLEV